MNNLFRSTLPEDVVRVIDKYGIQESLGMLAWDDGDELRAVEITEEVIQAYIDNYVKKQERSQVNNVVNNLKKPLDTIEKQQIKNVENFLRNPLPQDQRASSTNFLYRKLALATAVNEISSELSKEYPQVTREDLIDLIDALDNILVRVEYELPSLSQESAKDYFNMLIERIHAIANLYNENINNIFSSDITKYLSTKLYGNDYDLPNLLEQLDVKSQEITKTATYIDEVNYDLDDFEQYKLFLEDCKRSLCQEKFMRLWHHIAEKTNSNDMNEIAYIVGRELNIPKENIIELYSNM